MENTENNNQDNNQGENLVNSNPFVSSGTPPTEPTAGVEPIADSEPIINAEPATPVEETPNPVEQDPVVEQSPVEPVGQPTTPFTSTTPLPNEGLAIPQEPAKKSKGGLVALIIALVVLLLGGAGVVAAYFVAHTPEKIMTSIIDNFSSKNLGISGTIEVGGDEDNEPIKISLSSKTDGESQASASTTATTKIEDKTFDISASATVLKDYTLYFKMDGLKKIIKSYGDALNYSYGSSLVDFAEDIDGNWWKLSVPELIDSVDELSSSEKKEYKEKYDCAINEFNKLRDNDLKTYYKENPFIKLEKYTGDKNFAGRGDTYKVSLDAEKLVGYAKAIAKSTNVSGIIKCLDIEENSKEIEDNVDIDIVKKNLENFPEVILIVKNNFLGAELTGIYVEGSKREIEEENEGYSYTHTVGIDLKADISFSKNTETVTAPEGAKSVTELVDKVTELIQSAFVSSYSYDYPYPDCNSEDETNCVSVVETVDKRENDYSALSAYITSYIANNNGKVPPEGTLDASKAINSSGLDPDGNPYRAVLFPIEKLSSYQVPVVDSNGTDVYVVTKATCATADGSVGVVASGDNERNYVVYGALVNGGQVCLSSN